MKTEKRPVSYDHNRRRTTAARVGEMPRHKSQTCHGQSDGPVSQLGRPVIGSLMQILVLPP